MLAPRLPAALLKTNSSGVGSPSALSGVTRTALGLMRVHSLEVQIVRAPGRLAMEVVCLTRKVIFSAVTELGTLKPMVMGWMMAESGAPVWPARAW